MKQDHVYIFVYIGMYFLQIFTAMCNHVFVRLWYLKVRLGRRGAYARCQTKSMPQKVFKSLKKIYDFKNENDFIVHNVSLQTKSQAKRALN